MRWRLLVGEAAILLAVARLLVGLLRLRHWRHLLGATSRVPSRGPAPSAQALELARAVNRADQRTALGCKCLHRALALHWMLQRRGWPGQLVIAILDPTRRGTSDDLHAWIEIGGEIVIGATDQPHHPIARFGS